LPPRFQQSVVYMITHDETGAFGLIVNRPLGSGPLEKFLEGIGIEAEGVSGTLTLNYGGPVEPGAGFILHSNDYQGPGPGLASGELTFTTDVRVLKDAGAGKGPARLFVALGYAGWGPGQLEGELRRKDWLIAPGDTDLIFDVDPKERWDRALARAGVPL
jgi:putative transcriptional regulator